MKSYHFSIPQKYATQEHQLGLGPDDMFIVKANSRDDAVAKVIYDLGEDSYMNVYDPQEDAEIIAAFYPGRRLELD